MAGSVAKEIYIEGSDDGRPGQWRSPEGNFARQDLSVGGGPGNLLIATVALFWFPFMHFLSLFKFFNTRPCFLSGFAV